MVLYLKKVKLVNKLSDLTTKRVIILVLAMLFSVPIFTASTYINDNDSTDIGLAIIDYFKNDTKSKAFNISIDTYIDVHSNIKTPIISLYIQVDKYIYEWDKEGITPDDLRFSETGATILNDGDFTAIFDLRWYTKVSSALSVGRTIFIWFVLATGALWFSKDANDLVIVPIESMIEKVNRIAKNPLEAAQEEENEELALEKNKNNNQTKTGCKYWRKSKKEAPYETVILERTIIKIGALLALGFGEAGTKIIADNISKTGDVDPMIPGTKVVAIFWFLRYKTIFRCYWSITRGYNEICEWNCWNNS